MKQKYTSKFKIWVKMLSSRDVAIHEDGFHYLLTHLHEVIDYLIEEFNTTDNDDLKVLLLQLISYAQAPQAFDILAQQLRSDNYKLRKWAIDGLKNYDTNEALQILVEARYYELATPKATQELREEINNALGPEQPWEQYLRRL